MSEVLELTMDALLELYVPMADRGWRLRVYDYALNRWFPGEEAFARTGAYELAILSGPEGSHVRVRLLPPGRCSINLEAGSAGDPSVWEAMGVRLRGRELELVMSLLTDRTGPVPLRELVDLLAVRETGDDDEAETAAAVRRALLHLLSEEDRSEGGAT